MQQEPLSLETLLGPLAGCAVALFLTARPGLAMGVIILVPILLVAWLCLAVVAWRKPQLRLRCAVKALLYVLTLCLYFALHQFYQVRAEAHAQTVSAAIEQFRQSQGSYPSNLAQLKLPQADDWRLRYSLSPDGKPFLHRPRTLNAFDKYFYDFETHEWEFRPD